MVDIEKLLSQPEVHFENAALQAAVEKNQKSQLETLTDHIVDLLKERERIVSNTVGSIRLARKMEKDAKARIKEIETGFQALQKTGNPTSLVRAIFNNNSVASRWFTSRGYAVPEELQS